MLGILFNEEIERVNDRHFGDEVYRDGKLAGFFREDESRQPVTIGILLPVEKVLLWFHCERIAFDWRAAVSSRAQADFVRRKIDRAVKLVVGFVVKGNSDCHGFGS